MDSGGGGLGELLKELVHGAWYMPHGHCYLWKPELVWLHVISDMLIGGAYVLISFVLYVLVRRIRLPFSTMIIAFGVFIGACGLTHFMEVWNVWYSAYWLAGWVKAITAVASVLTSAYLVKLRPTIVQVASAARLSEERRVELEMKNRELEALYTRVREVDELKTQFFANMSHELRTPLALILGPAERLLAEEPPDSGRRQDMEVVQRNARVLLRRVNSLLDAAKLDAGKMGLAYARADLAGLVRLSTANFDSLARERHISFQVEGPSPLPCEVDVEKFERVLLNLLSNAFKFTPEVGRIRCAWEAAGGRARLVVEDSGPGVPSHLRDTIFERFRQGAGGTTREFGGTGLGLAIARDFVELHGGTLRVDESPLGGARFVVELPLVASPGATVREHPSLAPEALRAEASITVDTLRAEQSPPPDAPAPEAGGEAQRSHVLVVEDTPDMRTFVASVLAEEFRVDTARDGQEGLRKAEALRPDVLVTDLMMPHMSGDVLVRRMRAQPELTTIPILLLSARADDALRVELLGGGAQDYLVKPFVAAELRARVRNLAVMKRTREVLQEALAARSTDVEALARELATRQRQVRAALESVSAARAHAETVIQTQSTLLRLISHELRTPLASLQLSLHLLNRQEGFSDRQRESLDRLGRATSRLQSTVETVVEFTRLESGNLVTKVSEVDLSALARELVEEFRPEAQRKLLALDVVAPVEPVTLRTDERLVRLILMNLVSNALKYTDTGSIRVRVESAPDVRRLVVEDTGRGIAQEEQARIFEPFQQLETVQRKTTPGLGLGLALVRDMVAALGGTVSLTSEVGRGSTFVITLTPLEPLAEEQANARPTPP